MKRQFYLDIDRPKTPITSFFELQLQQDAELVERIEQIDINRRRNLSFAFMATEEYMRKIFAYNKKSKGIHDQNEDPDYLYGPSEEIINLILDAIDCAKEARINFNLAQEYSREWANADLLNISNPLKREENKSTYATKLEQATTITLIKINELRSIKERIQLKNLPRVKVNPPAEISLTLATSP